MFDPSQKRETNGLNGEDIPAGVFPLAIVSFEPKETDKHVPYNRCSFQILGGPAKGRRFSNSIFLNHEDDPRTAGKLQLFCEAMRLRERFDPADDADFAKAFLGRPFIAEIKTSKRGQYTNTDIKRFVLEGVSPNVLDKLEAWRSEKGIEIYEKWLEAFQNRQESGGDDGEGDFTQGFNPDDFSDF